MMTIRKAAAYVFSTASLEEEFRTLDKWEQGGRVM